MRGDCVSGPGAGFFLQFARLRPLSSAGKTSQSMTEVREAGAVICCAAAGEERDRGAVRLAMHICLMQKECKTCAGQSSTRIRPVPCGAGRASRQERVLPCRPGTVLYSCVQPYGRNDVPDGQRGEGRPERSGGKCRMVRWAAAPGRRTHGKDMSGTGKGKGGTGNLFRPLEAISGRLLSAKETRQRRGWRTAE